MADADGTKDGADAIAAPPFLLECLGRPKERKMLVRLEAELLRLLRNPSALKLEMQPMTGYNASLVEVIAHYFELGFSFVDAEPEDVPAGASADQCQKSVLRTVTLRKLEESKVPTLRLEELLPAPAPRAVSARGGAVPGKSGDAGAGEGGNPPRIEPSDSLDAGKVQLLRRAKAQSQDKAPEPARLSAQEVEARLRDKEAEYEAARRRIMGETAVDAPTGAAASEPNGAAQAAVGQPKGVGEVPAIDGGHCGGNGTTVAARISPALAPTATVAPNGGISRSSTRVTTAVGKAAGRAQDRNDPDYDRSRILRQGSGGMGAVAPAPCCMGGAGSMAGAGSMGSAGRAGMGGAHNGMSPSGAAAEMARIQLGVQTGYASPIPTGSPGMGYGVAGAYFPCLPGCGSAYTPSQMGCCAPAHGGPQQLGYGEFGAAHAPHSQQPFHHSSHQQQPFSHISQQQPSFHHPQEQPPPFHNHSHPQQPSHHFSQQQPAFHHPSHPQEPFQQFPSQQQQPPFPHHSQQPQTVQHHSQQHQLPTHFNSMAGGLGGLGGGYLWPVATGLGSAYSAPPAGASTGEHASAGTSGALGYGAPVKGAPSNAHSAGYVGGPLCGASQFGAPGVAAAMASAALPGVMMSCGQLPGMPLSPPHMAGRSTVMLPGAYAPVPGHSGSLPRAMIPGFAVPVPRAKPYGGGGGGRLYAVSPQAAAGTAEVWQPPPPTGPPPQRT
jgi:hypothetical protein